MGGGYIAEALVFLLSTLFGLYLLTVALRFLLQWVRADFYNPLSQFLVVVTNPALRPLRRIIPGFAGIDWPSIVLMLTLKLLELVLISLVLSKPLPGVITLLLLAMTGILKLFIYIYMVVIFIQVIISWINPGAYNAVTVLMYKVSEPLLRPARRLIPPVSGIDFSPLVVLIALQLSLILVIKPLTHLAWSAQGLPF